MSSLYALSAAVAFALMNFVLKHFCEGASAGTAAFVRGLVGALLLFPVFWKSRRVYFTFHGRKIWFRSLVGAASVMCLFMNLKQASVADAIMLSNLSPVFVILFQAILYGKRLSVNEVTGTILVVVGLIVLASPNVQALSVNVVFVGLLGAIFAAMAYLTLKQASKDFAARQIVWAFCFVNILMASAFGGATESYELVGQVFAGLQNSLILLWLIVAGLLGLAAQLLMTKAFSRLPALVATSLTLTVVIWGMLFESIYVREMPKISALVNYLVVIAGLVVLQAPTGKGRGIPSRV